MNGNPSSLGSPTRTARAGVRLALFLTGFGTFVNLYATQPLLPYFREVFHASELQVSLTISAPVLAVALAAPLVGLVADSLGRKRVIVAAMLGLTLPTALAATAANLGQLIGWRLLQGLFTPGIIAVAMAYISEETPPQAVGATMATYVSGTVVGGFAGRCLAGLVAAHWGWRPAMLLLAAATLAGALITWWLLPRSTRFTPHADLAASLRSLRAHLHNRQLLATYVVGFNVLFCLVGAFTYVNFHLADAPFHLGTAELAWVFSVYLIGAAVTPTAGRILDRIGHRRAIAASAAMVAAGMLLTLVPWVPAVITGLAMAASGAFASQSTASSHVGKVAGQARSSAAGLYVGLYYLGGCAGSILPGFFWRPLGWSGCVGLVLVMQGLVALIARLAWAK